MAKLLIDIFIPSSEMKKVAICLIVIPVIFLFSCNMGTVKNNKESHLNITENGTPELIFSEYEHDFGQVNEGTKVSHIFQFENKGQGNLVIHSANTTCGCTVPRFSKKPIPPGKQGSLEVVFDTSGKHGIQTKTITVRSNAKTPVVIVKITADIISDK